MTNKTIATIFAVSMGLCVLGYMVQDGSFFYMIGGIGAIVGSILATVRLFKLEPGSTLGTAHAITSAVFFLAAGGGAESSAVGLTSIAFWITSVWSIIRLYNTK